jgi:hypothetical protein
MKRSLCAALLFGAVLGASGSASAQVWLSDRTLSEGRGIRTGNFELHPGIGAEFGYDSNAFYQSAADAAGVSRSPPSALRLRISPSFSVSTLSAQRLRNSSTTASQPTVNFRAGLGLGVHLFFSPDGVGNPSTLNGVDGTASIRADFFPGRTWQFSIGDEFQRSIQAGSEVLLADRTTTSPTRNFNTATLELAYAPGRGTFEVRLGYNFIANIFDNPGNLADGRNYSSLNYLSHDITARVRWRFLPKTAVLFDAGVTPTSYLSSGTAGWYTGLFDSTPIRARVGLNGLITEKIALLAMVGYQATFFSGGDNADTVIGQAELRWIISDLANFRVGFQRDIQNSFIGNFVTRNRGYLTYQHSFNRRFLLQLDGSVAYQEYGYVSQASGARLATVTGVDSVSGRFSAVRAEGSVFGEYRFTEVFGMNLTFAASSNITDAAVGLNRLDFTRFSAFLGARLAW